MRLLNRQLISMLMIFTLSFELLGLVPFESLFLGKIPYQKDLTKDPLNYILSRTQSDGSIRQEKEILMRYVGYFREGENLRNRCFYYDRPEFISPQQRVKAMRVIMHAYQYVGIDLSVRAIVEYAKNIGMDKDDFSTLSNNLVNNYCSKNMTMISHKELYNNFVNKFEYGSGFLLPEISDIYKLFPAKEIKSLQNKQAISNKELNASVKLFKSFCSWGNEPSDPRLLEVFFNDTAYAAFIIRKLVGKRIEFDSFKRIIYKKKTDESVHIACRSQICRRSDKLSFLRSFPRIIGSSNIESDLEKVYCSEIKDGSFTARSPKKINDIKKKITKEDEILLQSHLHALITGVPDFIFQSNDYAAADAMFQSSITQTWNQWSEEVASIFSQDLTYEESLTVELLKRKFYVKPNEAKFSVHFRVALGEFDRSLNDVDKISVKYPLKLQKSFLRWIDREVNRIDPTQKNELKHFKAHVKNQLKDQINLVSKKFVIKPWDGDLSQIIVNEIIDQVGQYSGKYFRDYNDEVVEVPLHFHFGLFALSYINYRLKRKNNPITYSAPTASN